MDLTTDLGDDFTNSAQTDVEKDEAEVKANIGAFVGKLLRRLQKETRGDAGELKTKTSELLARLEAGNDLFTPQTASAPKGATAALGTGATTSSTEAERIGTDVLAMVGGDATKANGGLDMLRKIVGAGHDTAVLAGQLFDGLTADQVRAAGTDLGDFIITVVRDVADNKDEIVSRGIGAELKSATDRRRDNGMLKSQIDDLLHKIGAGTTLTGAQAALDKLRNDANQAVSVANQARATSLNNVGTALGLTRLVSGETDDAFEIRLIDVAKKAIGNVNSLTTRLSTADSDAETTRKDFLALVRRNGVTVKDSDASLDAVKKMITQKGGLANRLTV